jgi:NADH:ubiquinone reductase (non-electrogenic)
LSAVRDREGVAMTEESKKEMEDLARQLEKLKLRPFHCSHQGSLAYVSFFSFWNGIRLSVYPPYRYIGSEKAIADLPFFNGNVSVHRTLHRSFFINFFLDKLQFASGGMATYLFWRSAYLSTLFSLRNRTLVATDWLKVKLFGRSVPDSLFPPEPILI